MTLKILHVGPGIGNGGVINIIYNLCKAQIQYGYEVSMYEWEPHSIITDTIKSFLDLNVRIIPSNFSNKYDLRHIAELRNLVKGFDIVHVHLFPNQLYTSIATTLLPKRKRPLLITTEHNTYNNRRRHSVLRYIDAWFYSKYDSIVCISEATKRNLDLWLCNPNIEHKVIVINNGINLSLLENAKDVLRDELNLPTEAKIVIMVSRLTYPKDPITLVKAIALCDSDIHAVFIGYGNLEPEIEKESKKLNIQKRIHLLGKKDTAAPYLKGADIGVLSTHWDGFGLVAVEYMAAGLPVIASDVDGLRDIVGLKENLFKVGDYKGLAKKIKNIFDNKDKYYSDKRFFAQRAESFNIDKMIYGYNRLYNSLVRNKRDV